MKRATAGRSSVLPRPIELLPALPFPRISFLWLQSGSAWLISGKRKRAGIFLEGHVALAVSTVHKSRGINQSGVVEHQSSGCKPSVLANRLL